MTPSVVATLFSLVLVPSLLWNWVQSSENRRREREIKYLETDNRRFQEAVEAAYRRNRDALIGINHATRR